MALSQSSQLVLKVVGALQNISGGSTSQDNVTSDYSTSFGNGSGANQASEIYHQFGTSIAASGSTTLTLSALTDALGNAIAFTRIVAMIIAAAAANVNNLVVGNAGTHPWSPMFDAATDTVTIKPGGILILTCPVAAGYPVSSGATDQLKLANSSSGTAVLFDLILIG